MKIETRYSIGETFKEGKIIGIEVYQYCDASISVRYRISGRTGTYGEGSLTPLPPPCHHVCARALLGNLMTTVLNDFCPICGECLR